MGKGLQDLDSHGMYEANFRLVVESAPDGVVIVDAEGRIILLNAAAESLFGYARDDLLGRNLEPLIRDSGCPADLFRGPGDPAGTRRSLTALRKDGSTRPVEVRLASLRMPSGVATMVNIIDVSEREKVEADLRRSEARFRAIAENFPGLIFQRVAFHELVTNAVNMELCPTRWAASRSNGRSTGRTGAKVSSPSGGRKPAGQP